MTKLKIIVFHCIITIKITFCDFIKLSLYKIYHSYMRNFKSYPMQINNFYFFMST